MTTPHSLFPIHRCHSLQWSKVRSRIKCDHCLGWCLLYWGGAKPVFMHEYCQPWLHAHWRCRCSLLSPWVHTSYRVNTTCSHTVQTSNSMECNKLLLNVLSCTTHSHTDISVSQYSVLSFRHVWLSQNVRVVPHLVRSWQGMEQVVSC